MAIDGNWSGQWQGEWQGGGDAPEGNLSGACSFAFSVEGNLKGKLPTFAGHQTYFGPRPRTEQELYETRVRLGILPKTEKRIQKMARKAIEKAPQKDVEGIVSYAESAYTTELARDAESKELFDVYMAILMIEIRTQIQRQEEEIVALMFEFV